MKAKYKALDIAQYFLYRANVDGDLITNLKMQKLLYYAQAWHLVNFSTPLYNDPIMAWRYGPIIESVYHSYKRFKYSPIKCENAVNIIEKISINTRNYLDEFYKVFISYSASDLTQMSHNEAPWKDTRQNNEITVASIEGFYKKQYEKYVAQKQKKEA